MLCIVQNKGNDGGGATLVVQGDGCGEGGKECTVLRYSSMGSSRPGFQCQVYAIRVKSIKSGRSQLLYL